MDYLETIQKSIDQIEDQVQGDIHVDRLAACAGFSTYHFYRIFEAYVGMPVMEYARRRRIAHAAYAMAFTPRLIDIAVAYGFETHAGFSKTFRRCMGSTPEQYRMHAPDIPPQRIVLADILKYVPNGGIIMEPKIMDKAAAKIAGFSIHTTSVEGKNNREIPAFWQAFMSDGRMEALCSVPGIVSDGELGLCVGTDMETGEFDYVIGVEVSDLAAVPDSFYKMDLPACTYAVFTTPPSDPENFSSTIQGTWKYIYQEWFPASGYEFASGHPDFELYGERSQKPSGQQCDIYIPIAKKG